MSHEHPNSQAIQCNSVCRAVSLSKLFLSLHVQVLADLRGDIKHRQNMRQLREEAPTVQLTQFQHYLGLIRVRAERSGCPSAETNLMNEMRCTLPSLS